MLRACERDGHQHEKTNCLPKWLASDSAHTSGLKLNEDVDLVDGQRGIETIVTDVKHLDGA